MAPPTDQTPQSTTTVTHVEVAVTVNTSAADQAPAAPPAASATDPEPAAAEGSRTAGLPRRLGALIYDGILLFAVLFFATALFIVPYDLIAARPYPQHLWHYHLLFQVYLVAVTTVFFVYFWTHGGQTLGMRAWRIRVERLDGTPLAPRDALRRLGWAALGLAPAGLGLWWCLFDRERLAWYDRRSDTRVIEVPRRR